jgi:hypothetical protein
MRCKLYNVLYYYQRSTCFGRVFRPSSGAYKTVCAALGIFMLSCCLPLGWMGWNSNPSTPPSRADRLNIWEPQPPETLGTCPVLYKDSFACIGALGKLRKATISLSCLSLRPSVCLSGWNNSAPTGRIFVKFDI